MVDFDCLLTPVAVKREILEFRFRQNLGVGFLPAPWADKKTVFIRFRHVYLALWWNGPELNRHAEIHRRTD